MTTGIADITADRSNDVGVVSRIDIGDRKHEITSIKCAEITTSPPKSSKSTSLRGKGDIPTADIKSNKIHAVHPNTSANNENGAVPLPNSTNVNIVTLQSTLSSHG